LAGLTLFGVVRRTRWRPMSLSGSSETVRSKPDGDIGLHLALVVAVLWTVHPCKPSP
jgi:hypothetical protein